MSAGAVSKGPRPGPSPGADLRLLELTLTSRCNLACGYCFRTRGEGRLAWNTAGAALDLLLASRRPVVELSITGGEPLLELALLERILGHLEHHRRPTQAVVVRMTTNGLLLDEAAADLLAGHRVRTQISFDGLPELQARRGAGTYEVLEQRLRDLRSRHRRFWTQDVGTTMTVTPESVALLPAAVRASLALGVQRVELSPDVLATSGWDAGRRSELEAALAEVAAIAVEHVRATGTQPIPLLRPGQGTCVGGCGAASGEGIAVDADGQVYGCGAFAPEALAGGAEATERMLVPLRLGRLLDPEFGRRLARYPELATRLPLLRPAAATGSTLGRCATCPARHECAICPLLTSRDGVPGSVPDFHCAFQLAASKARAAVAEGTRGTKTMLGMGVPEVLRRLGGQGERR